MHHNGFSTHRLRAEALTPDHASVVWDGLQDERLYEFSAAGPLDLDALQKRYNFLAGAKSPDGTELWLNWVLFLLETNEPVGVIQATVLPNSTASIAYEIFADRWQRGFGSESVLAMLQVLLEEFGADVVVAEMDVRNTASVALAEAVGMTLVRRQQSGVDAQGEAVDEYRYELLAVRPHK